MTIFALDVINLDRMPWYYFSPHLDDIALSCGGLLWEQAEAGELVEVWTLCAGDPPDGPLSPFAQSLHSRWETGAEAVGIRRLEDAAACQRLGAAYRHFGLPDCIYRRSPVDGSALYPSEESIFGPLHPAEGGLVHDLSVELDLLLPGDAVIVCPLTLGGHVDHRLARAAIERIARPVWYFADYPYARQHGSQITDLLPDGYELVLFKISESGMQAWGEAVAAHRSQISTFWPDTQAMVAALGEYYQDNSGIPLWRPGNGGA